MAAESEDKDKNKDKNKDNASELKEASVVCNIEFNGIITALHEKALSQIKEEAYTIQNSAIDGEGKDAKFYGAGSHIIAAIPKENKGLDKNKIPKDIALKMIQTYVQWFVGPDLKTGIADKDLIPLENEDSGKVEDTHQKKQDIEKSRGSAEGSEKVSTASKEKYKESFDRIPSFSEYLLLEADPEASSEGSPDASGESGTDDKGSSNSDSSGSSKADPKASGSDSSSSGSESATGYYIAYQLDTKPGEKGKPIADALKKMGADLLKGFGISVGSWRSGSSGDVHTIGDLMNSLDAVFGKIDPKELEAEYGKEMAKKFKDGDYQIKVIDTPTIIKHLNKQLAGSDKSKIKNAEMALCTKVNKKDKSYKLYNKQVIADSITSAISGIFKKFKNKVTAKDVILVNNYSDNKKNKGEVKYTEKGEGAVEDSLVTNYNGKILNEAVSVEDRRKNLKQKLDEIAKKKLGESYKKSDVLPSKDVIELLKKNGIDEPKIFSQLEEAQNSFYICTVADEEKTKSESLAVNSMLRLLFEDEKANLKADVEKTFTDLIYSFKDYLPKGKEISEKAINNVQELVAENPAESLRQQFKLASQIFEDLSFDDYGVILEAGSHTAAHINEIIDRVGAKNLIANKDKIIAAAKEAYKGTSDTDKDIRKKLIGSKAKTKVVKWDDERIKGWNKKHPDDKRKAGYTEEVKVGEDTPGIFDKFFKLSDDKSMKAFVDKEFGDVSKDEDTERIVQGFWNCLDLAKLPDREPEDEETPKKPEPPEPLPEEVKELKIGFLDRNPESNELDDPEYVSTKVGGSVTPPKPKYESDKHKFNGWRDQNGVLGEFDDIKEPKSYTAEYAHEVELDKFIVTFQDFNPETGEITDIESQTVSKGGSAKEPKIPEHEGWKFKEWTQPFDNVTASIETMTLWDQDIKIIPKVPKDPEKPKDDLEPIGDPISYDPKKPIKEQLPELPKKDGWESDGWDPDPESIKDPKENIEIIGKYKKEDFGSGSTSSKKISYWVIPDENGLLTGTQFKFYDVDPENPEDKDKWKSIDGYDSISDATELDFPDKDKLSDNGDYKFVGEWTPSKDQLKNYDVNNPDEKDLITDKKTKTQYIAIRPVYARNAFKFYDVDPEKPNDKSKWKPIENFEPTNTPNEATFPTKDDLTDSENYKFVGEWTPSKDQLKNYDVNNPDEKDLITDKKTKTQYIAIRPVYARNAFTIKLTITDPEDPDNTKSQKSTDIQVLNGKYKVDDLKQLAKDTESKDEAAKYTEAAKKNEEAFKSVENIAELEKTHKPYKFLGWTTDENGDEPTFEKKEIQEVVDELLASGKANETDEVNMKSVWSNDIKAVHTELDFYIVPMKGLKEKSHYDNATGRTVDG